MHLAAVNGFVDIMRLLYSSGADPNAEDDDGNTPLHYSSQHGHIQGTIFLVIEANADPCLKNKVGYMPSDIAQNIEMRKFFQKYVNRETLGVDEEVKGSMYGRTAFNGVLLHNDRATKVQKLMQSTLRM